MKYLCNNFNSGVVIRQWGTLVPGQRAEATTFIMANSITVRTKISEAQFSTNETKEIFANFWEAHKAQPLVGRDIILGSLCPQMYGMYTVKTALAVVLAGGVPKTQDSGSAKNNYKSNFQLLVSRF